MGKSLCLVLLVFMPGLHVLADGFALLNNRTPTGDVRVQLPDGTGAGTCYRAALVVVGGDGQLTELYPQTNFRAGAAASYFVNSVVVPIPGRIPGDIVTVRMMVFSGEFVLGASNDFPLQLGEESAPAPLNGMVAFNVQLTPLENFTPILDSTFTASLTRFGQASPLNITALLGQPDGKIIVSGNFTEVNGLRRTHIARLHPSGEFDDSFAQPFQLPASIQFAELQPDGKILLAGHFAQPDGSARSLVRLLTNGIVDSEFNSTLDEDVTALSALVDGGFFLAYGENPASLVLLDQSGLPSPSFVPITFSSVAGPAAIHAISQSEPAALWIGGEFSSAAGRNLSNLARIGLDGAVDPNWDGATGGPVFSIAGNLIGGSFQAINSDPNCPFLIKIGGTNLQCGWEALAEPARRPWDTNHFPVVHHIASEGRVLIVESGTNVYALHNSSYLNAIWANGPLHVAVEHAAVSNSPRRPDLLIAGSFSEVPVFNRWERHMGIARFVPVEGLRSVALNPPIKQGSVLIIPRYYTGEIEFSTDLETWLPNPRCIMDTAGEVKRFYRRKSPE